MSGSAPNDLFFRDIVLSYVEAPRFLRRDWLSAELQSRLDGPDCRVALLTAEPGAGKSAFMAQLANEHPDWLCYFIRRDQRTSLGESSGRSFLLRTGFQLAAKRPELFDLEQIRIEVEQRIGDASGDVVGATIDRIRASPFHQTVVRITQEVRRTEGSVTGLRVGEWIADPRLIEIDDLQQMALFAPARSLLRVAPKARIVILIDALDELRFGELDGNLLQWLANGPPLPTNVRIILTSRPSHEQLDTFVKKRKESLALLPLDASDHRMQADVRSYAAALVAPAEISAALQETGRTPDAFSAELTTRADGNIGYAAALGRAFDQALQNPEHRALLVQLLGLARLPDDTRQLFAFFLRLIQTGPGGKGIKVTDPKTGRAAILDAWPELYHPILALLAVALEPLTLDQIHALSGSVAERHQVAHAIGWLEQFLDKIGDRYRLYHATFASFLTATETRASAEMSDLWVDSSKEHRRVAELLEDKGGPDVIWQDSQDAGEQGRRDYARLHYIMHLYLGESWERLAAVVESGEYGRGKLRFDRSTYLYARDLDLAIRAVTREGLGEEARLAELPRLWSFKLLRSSLASYANLLPGYAYQALAMVGRDREATDLAELITDPKRQSLAFIMIAPVLATQPDGGDRAAGLVRRAGETATRVEDGGSRSALLRELIDVLRPLASASEAAGAAREAVVALGRSFHDPEARAEALANAALALLAGGYADDAFAIRLEIETLLATQQDHESAAYVRYTYCALSVDLGDYEAAYAAAGKMPDPGGRVVVLAQLAVRQQESGAMETAEITRAAIEAIRSATPPGQSRAYIDAILAEVYLRGNDKVAASALLADALDQLRQESAPIDIPAALDVARVLQKANDTEGLAAVVRMLREAAVADLPEAGGGSPQSFKISVRAAEAARGLANLDQREQALEIIRKLNSYERGSLLLAVVESFVRHEEFDQALAIADEIRETLQQSMVRVSMGGDSAQPTVDADAAAFRFISSALAAGGRWKRALEAAEKVGDTELRIEAFSRVAILQFHAGHSEEAADIVTRIMREVRLSNTTTGRDGALQQVAELFVQAQQWLQAREVARSIVSPYTRSDTQASIERALIEAGEFDTAQGMLFEVTSGSTQAESLLALIRKVHSLGGTPNRPTDNASIVRMLHAARAYAEQDEEKASSAAALRSIAIAFAELYTGDRDGAFSTLGASVDAMNKVPRFRFAPTPWCDTAVAYAKLGGWDTAMKIATWQVETNPFDGCYSLRDLAVLAGTTGDMEQAKALFAQARETVSRIQMPPHRSAVLGDIAKEYARLGMLEEAREVAGASGEAADVQVRIAVALLESGKTAEGLEAIDDLEGRIPEDGLFILIGALLTAGEIDRALSMVAKIPNPTERAERLVHVARRQIASGRQSDARENVTSALELAGPFLDEWSARSLSQAIPAAFAELGDFVAARRFIEERWLAAPTRVALLTLTALVRPLVPRQRDLPNRIHASFAWVEQTLLAV